VLSTTGWEEEYTSNQLLSAVDQALYRAKASGRNCVRTAELLASDLSMSALP